jgi:hypothetical protein
MVKVELITRNEMNSIGIPYQADESVCSEHRTNQVYGGYSKVDGEIIYRFPWQTDPQNIRLNLVKKAFDGSGLNAANSIFVYVDEDAEAAFKNASFSIRIIGN